MFTDPVDSDISRTRAHNIKPIIYPSVLGEILQVLCRFYKERVDVQKNIKQLQSACNCVINTRAVA